ncbi:MAG: hypothetical protein QXG36_01085 [Nitrososphaeria archaeon]
MTVKEKIKILHRKFLNLKANIWKTLRIDLIKDNALFLIIFAYFAFYSSGIINTILEAGRLPSTALFTPYKNFQTWIEFTVAVFNFIGGSVGVYLIWRGANSISSKDARINFIIGMLLLIISTAIGVIIMYTKYML